MTPTARTALLADGSTCHRDTAAAALRAAGFDVRVAADGAHALLLLAGFTPDVAVIDVLLPEVNGFQVLDAIKDTIRLPTRVLVTSGLRSDAHRRYAYALGADGFLGKPYTDAELAAAVERVFAPPAAPAADPRPRSVAV